MKKPIGRGQYTIVHLHDGKCMQMNLLSNLPTIQHYSLINKNYSPDYTTTPIVITPELYFSGSKDNQISKVKNPVWTINGEAPIQYGGVVKPGPPYSLTINKNMVVTMQLNIVFSCIVTDPDTLLDVKISSDICYSKQDVDGYTPMMMLETPDGNLFKNEIFDSLTAVCKLMVGTKDISTNLKKVWYSTTKNGQYVELKDSFLVNGQGTNTLKVSREHVTSQSLFKCEIYYKDSIYTEFVTFSRQIDPYTLKIENKNGDKMKNGYGVIYCEAHVYRSGQMIPDDKAERMFKFKWRKYNKYTGVLDEDWRSPTTRTVELTSSDIDTLSTFMCELTLNTGTGLPYTLPFNLL